MYNVLLQCKPQFKGFMVCENLLVFFHVLKFVMINTNWPAMLVFLNVSDIMHHIEHYYINSLTCRVIWNGVRDIFAFLIIYNNLLTLLKWYCIVFYVKKCFLWTLNMIENTLAMERFKICLRYGMQV